MTAPETAPGTAPGKAPEQAGWHVDVPLLGPVGWPPTGSLAFVVVLGGLAAAEVIAWPVAIAVGVGHVFARDHDHRLVREVGEGLEVA
ncbi:hypothetical protein PHK61_28575 [Actinomycetospora lutea]|uniref:hypothetical protein n=1 Tax=Actinomycetospora lutea TaxID=663604 RepID=UPI002365618A|nr:hypothetical protein [Actinomycetospora lutea]MDD7942377.1 hypothetical protein [Actinomycetospora lutea]